MKKKIFIVITLALAFLLSGCVVEEPTYTAICVGYPTDNHYSLQGNSKSTHVNVNHSFKSEVAADVACGLMEDLVKNYDPRNGSYSCGDLAISARYNRKHSLEEEIKEIEDSSYECIMTSPNEEMNKTINGSWCLSYTYKDVYREYKITFNEDGTYKEREEYRSSLTSWLKEGIYYFDGEQIKRMEKRCESLDSSYEKEYEYNTIDGYLSYDEDKDVIVDSNILPELPNEYTRCD